MTEIEFLDTPIIYINTKDLNDQEEADLADKIDLLALKQSAQIEVIDSAIYPRDGNYSIQDLIELIKKVLFYLQRKNISWTGGKSSFKDSEELGFMILKDTTLTVTYIDENGDLEKEHINLVKRKI
jgi:hypothetical protein